jgi:hypothetical protein
MRTRTLSHSRKAQLLTALAVLALAGVASGLATAGSSTLSMRRLGSNAVVPAGKVAALNNRTPFARTGGKASAPRAGATDFTPDPIPAEILGSDVPVPISSSIIAETNGWLVSDGYNLVAVYAGSKGDDPTQGRVAIVRQDLVAGQQTVQIIDAGPTGALTVAVGAPTGTAVETSAQTGVLRLSTSRGTTVMLNLNTNTFNAK